MIHAAAIRLESVIYTLPAPKRHPDIFAMIVKKYMGKFPYSFQTVEKGFLDDKGNFLTREEAGAVALACGQVKELHVGKELYSEEVW